MLTFIVQDFGTSKTLGGRIYEEYRIVFVDDERTYKRPCLGMFRLTACQGRWVVPHRDIIEAMVSYLANSGRNPKVRRTFKRNVAVDRYVESYHHYEVFGFYGARIGPLQAPQHRRLLFVDDMDGGCTGYCELGDLDVVLDSLNQVWDEPPGENALAAFMQLAPKVLTEQKKETSPWQN